MIKRTACRTKEDQEMKGLYEKWAVRRPHPDCEALGRDVVKVEYARDGEGRLWRRIMRERIGRRWGTYGQHWIETTRWHVADMYAWFPGADPATIQGARKQNTRARPPTRFDAYLIRGRVDIVVRPDHLPAA
jgi:hypothetical protein